MGTFTYFLAALLPLFHTAAALPANTAKVLGCGKQTNFDGFTLQRSVANDRSYWYHLPSNYSPNTQYPVVLGFHGSSKIGAGLDGIGFEVDSQLSSSRFSSDKITVYPNGKGGVWAGPSYGVATIQEDLQFVQDVLADLNNTFCVDPNRIYATGHSNGAGFLDTIACSSTSDYFAAFALAAGSFYTDNSPNSPCTPARLPVPMLEFHGGADKDVNYTGGPGEGGTEPAIPDWLSWWAKRNGCPTENPQVDTFNGDVHYLTWNCSGKADLLQHYKVDDMGHVWPSTEINFSGIAAGKGPTHIEASEIVMTFFDRWTRYG